MLLKDAVFASGNPVRPIQAEVLNLLMEMRRDLGTTFVFVSHDLGVIAHMCDRVAVMRQGVIVETLAGSRIVAGEVAHGYTRGLLANCYSAQPVDLV
ncbi:MAG: transporter ATP-binding protein [Rhodoferax sp.]|nr:transporter ATP-binding protein [Rhodoferax sp.]